MMPKDDFIKARNTDPRIFCFKKKGNSAFKKGLFCYKNLLSLVNSAIKENNINMVLSLSVKDLSVLKD